MERETLLETARSLDKNLVVLAGDTHNAWANDLQTLNGAQAGVEFATSSVSSPGFEEYFADQNPDVLAAGVQQLIPGLKYANLQHRGYLVVAFAPEQCVARWQFVDTVKSSAYQLLPAYARELRALPGSGNRKLLSA